VVLGNNIHIKREIFPNFDHFESLKSSPKKLNRKQKKLMGKMISLNDP
jgi:hypothetical protein